MRLILAILLTALSMQAQQSLSSPVTVGGTNCGEIRLQEAFATGGAYWTWKACDDGFGNVESYLLNTNNEASFVGTIAGNRFYGSQTFRAFGSSSEYAGFWQTSNNSELYMYNQSNLISIKLTNRTDGHGKLELTDINGQGAARLNTGNTNGALLELDAADETRTGVRLRGGLFTNGGEALTYNVSSQLVNRLYEGGIEVYDPSSGTPKVKLNPLGSIDMFFISSPGNPPVQTGRLYLNGSGQACVRLPSGVDNCGGSGGAFVDLTSNQSPINGYKYFADLRALSMVVKETATSAARINGYVAGAGDGAMDFWSNGSPGFAGLTIRGNYASGGTAALEFFNPSSNVSTLLVKGGSSGTSSAITLRDPISGATRINMTAVAGTSGTVNLYDTSTERVRLNAASNAGVRLYDASGNQRLNLDGSGSGALITSPGNQLQMQQTGDSFGATTLTLRNTTGTNGIIITTASNDLSEFQLQGSAGTNRTVRMEGRSPQWKCGLSTAEIQFGFTDSIGNVDFGLIATRSGSCVPNSYPLRFMGSSSGFAAIKAPASPSGYTWTLPAADASGCISSNGSGTLSIVACGGGGGSFVDTTTNQNISGIKYTSGAWRASELAIKATSGGPAVWTAYVSAGIPYSDLYNSSGQNTLTTTGQELGFDVAAIRFVDPSAGSDTVKIRGGSASAFPAVTLYRSGGVRVNAGIASLLGGFVDIYDNNGTQVISLGGNGSGGRIRVWNGAVLATGFTGSLSLPGCTVDVVQGIITGRTGAC